MERYTITFVATMAVTLCSDAFAQYAKGKLDKVYIMQMSTNKFLGLMAALTCSWGILYLLGEGSDSSLGWWILAFAISMTVVAGIRYLFHLVWTRIWPVGNLNVVRVETPTSLFALGHLAAAAVELALAGLFIYLASTTEKPSAWVFIATGGLVLLFLAGAAFNVQAIRKRLGKQVAVQN